MSWTGDGVSLTVGQGFYHSFGGTFTTLEEEYYATKKTLTGSGEPKFNTYFEASSPPWMFILRNQKKSDRFRSTWCCTFRRAVDVDKRWWRKDMQGGRPDRWKVSVQPNRLYAGACVVVWTRLEHAKGENGLMERKCEAYPIPYWCRFYCRSHLKMRLEDDISGQSVCTSSSVTDLFVWIRFKMQKEDDGFEKKVRIPISVAYLFVQTCLANAVGSRELWKESAETLE